MAGNQTASTSTGKMGGRRVYLPFLLTVAFPLGYQAPILACVLKFEWGLQVRTTPCAHSKTFQCRAGKARAAPFAGLTSVRVRLRAPEADYTRRRSTR